MKSLDTLLFKMMTLSSMMQGAFLLVGCIGLYSVFSRDSRNQISEEVERTVNPVLSEISRNAILNNNAANDLVFLQVQTNLRLNSISLAENDQLNRLKGNSNCYEYANHVLCDQGHGIYDFLYLIETGQGKFKTLTLTKDVGQIGFRPIVDKILIVVFAAALMTLGLNVFLLLSTRKVITKDVNKLIEAFASKTNQDAPFAIKETEYLYSEFKGLLTAVEQSTKAAKDLEKDVAISKMTQMLAHDVRKPFSMLKTGLNLLQASSNDSHKFKSNLSFLVSEVDRATKSVDGMLSDVMEIGSTSNELIQEPVAPELLIESTLSEIFRVYPKSKISLYYNLNHMAMVNVHLKKVNRVFSNIVGNAVQAMNYSGTLWFGTKMSGDFIEFCIGNGGSLIPQESLGKLFDAFFTSGKKGGTGLGLAIAQKVVQAHGGKIWCESSKSQEYPLGKVEFFFTLPIAKESELIPTADLPKNSDEITQVFAMMGEASANKSDSEFNKNEALLYQEVVQQAKTLSRPLKILIVDDESIYRSALAGWIAESPELAKLGTIHHASGSAEAFDTLTRESCDLIITDIDMGPKSLCGFDLVKELRTSHEFKGLIFVHSNRIVPNDHRRAGELGADGFLPKPMAKGQLYKLLLLTIQSLLPQQVAELPNELDVNSEDLPALISEEVILGRNQKSPYNLIAIIDDEDIFRDQWPAFLKGYETVCYQTAEYFVKDWDRVSGQLIGVLTDKYLGPGMDGVTLGRMLRQKAPDLAIILSTSDIGVKDPSNIFDLIVDKDAFEEAPKIAQYFENKVQEESLTGLMLKTMRAFDAQARDLDLTPETTLDTSVTIDLHLICWEHLLKGLDGATKEQVKNSMTKLNKDKLKHDIKGSIARLKILLRNINNGELATDNALVSLKSRFTDLAKT